MTYEAKAHGKSPVQIETAHMISAAIEEKEFSIAAKLYAPIRAAFLRCRSVRLTPELEVAEQRCDGAEDVLQVAYQASPTRTLARERIRAIDAVVGKLIEQRLALVAQWDLR